MKLPGTVMRLSLAAAGLLVSTATLAEPYVLQCFYECKREPSGTLARFAETTTLMIANGRQPLAATGHVPTQRATLVFIDGRERVIAKAFTDLSPRDLDEVNVCSTLTNAATGLLPPSAGLVHVAITDFTANTPPGFGVNIWMKNIVGVMQSSDPEPFRGRVSGVGKTRCREIPQAIANPDQLLSDPEVQAAPTVPAILIEQTDEPNLPGS